MNEEELFCKLFPEYVVNGKPLSPYFDLFESGYEQAEKRIEELKEKLEKETAHRIRNFNKAIEWKEKHRVLKKENAELKEKVNILDNCDRLGDVITEAYKDQLIKAKKLLAKWVELFKPKLEGYPITPIQEQTEQFLSEVEK